MVQLPPLAFMFQAENEYISIEINLWTIFNIFELISNMTLERHHNAKVYGKLLVWFFFQWLNKTVPDSFISVDTKRKIYLLPTFSKHILNLFIRCPRWISDQGVTISFVNMQAARPQHSLYQSPLSNVTITANQNRAAVTQKTRKENENKLIAKMSNISSLDKSSNLEIKKRT